jgi:aryl-alcohol dehydrogenase-like predicted oxidoreductase
VLPDAGPAGAQVVASVEASLRRLGIDVIDLYQVGVAQLDQDVEELAQGLHDVVRRGLVRQVGVTNLPSWQLERVAATVEREAYAPVVAAQMSYSLLERTIEIEYRGVLEDRGIGVIAWSPLAGGFLTGKYTRNDPGGHGGRLETFHLQPLDRERGFAVLDVVLEIAAGRALSADLGRARLARGDAVRVQRGVRRDDDRGADREPRGGRSRPQRGGGRRPRRRERADRHLPVLALPASVG